MMEIDLGGGWKFKRTEDTQYMEGNVPGSVYQDLLEIKKIPDPFFRDNEEQVLREADFDYEYVRSFNVADLDDREVQLVCEGIDTISEIFINNQFVANTKNMHRGYVFDIKHLLVIGENEIKIILKSPNKYVESHHKEEPIMRCPGVVDGFTHLRKAHYMFGWDWGPQLPDMGIWREIKIIGRNEKIKDYYITQRHTEGSVVLNVNVEATASELIEVEITSPEGEKYYGKGAKSAITIRNPKLWWHNGYGEQPLYDVKICLGREDCKKFRIGLRELGVKREKDEWGEKFCLMINGKEIFAMGSNYIPEDSLLPRMSEAKTRKLLMDCAAANHNCIRVWGGGIYAPDYFYDICDQLGLIVWQDFMYACGIYNFDDLEEEVIEETIYNIKRLRHHSCIALWCGNNEQEEAWEHWGWSKRHDLKYKADYIKQFEWMIPKLVKQYDPERFYWPSSPSSGGSFKEPRCEDKGDVHYWSVWHGLRPFEEYKKHYFRFVSEFGFQSFPNMKTIESFTTETDRNIFSYVMEKHQKNSSANEKILHYIAANYRYPYSLERTVYLSQLLQAEAMRYGVEHWRRNRGRCMGAIYWQTNDCWPVASWSGIDYYGRWKALHYKTKRFFAPELLSGDVEDTKVNLTVINDSSQTFKGKVKWQLTNAKGEKLQDGEYEVSVLSLDKAGAITLDFKQFMPTYKDMMDKVFQYRLIKDQKVISEECQLFVKPKHFNYENPYLTVQVRADGKIEITSKAFAQDIELELIQGDGLFSDNYFSLLPGTTKVVTCTQQVEAENVKVRSIYE